MFRRLKERLVEEVRHAPQLRLAAGGTTPSQDNSSDTLSVRSTSSDQLSPVTQYKEVTNEALENLIDLDDTGTSSTPKPVKFTIADEDDEVVSGQMQPSTTDDEKSMKMQSSSTPSSRNNSMSSKDPGTPLSGDFFLWYNQPQGPIYVPQSDIESEVDDLSTTRLDGVSKEELFAGFQKLRARLTKYKSKYGEVVKAFKEVKSEREKIAQILSENQDRALRRISELKEQCQLEQQAKAHLEDNLRVMLDEKDQMIHVLETKVRLLKEGNSVDVDSATETPSAASSQQSIDRDELEILDAQAQQDKVKRLEELLTRCKAALHGNRERNALLTQENASLLQQLEAKNDEMRTIQEKEAEVQAQLRNEMRQVKDKLESLKHQQEESVMAMAETKRNMHEELENRERQLTKTKEEVKSLISQKETLEREVKMQTNLATQLLQKSGELEKKLEVMEKTMEDEKQALMQELSRGKDAAISLIREENQKKLSAIEEETSKKLQAAKVEESKLKETLKQKETELKALLEEISALKEKLETSNSEVTKLQERITSAENSHREEMDSLKEDFEKVISTLKADKENQKQHYDDLIRDNEEQQKIAIENAKATALESVVPEKDKQIRELTDQVQSLTKQLQESVKKVENQDEVVNELREKCSLFEKQLNEKKEKEIAHNKARDAINNQLLQAQDSIKLLTSERDSLVAQVNSSNSNIAVIEELRKKYEASTQESKTTISNLKQQIDELVTERSSLLKQVMNCQEKIREAEKVFKDLRHNAEILRTAFTEDLGNVKCVVGDLENQTCQLGSKCKSLSESVQDYKQALDSTLSENHELRLSKEMKEKENEQLQNRILETEETVEKMKQDWLNEKAQNVATIDELRQSYASLKNQNAELLSEIEVIRQQAEAKEASLEMRWQDLLSEKQEQVDNLSNEKKNMDMELNKLRVRMTELAEVKNRIKVLEEEGQRTQEKHQQELSEKESECERKITAMESELSERLMQVSKENEGLKSELENCNAKAVFLENTRKELVGRVQELEILLETTKKGFEKEKLSIQEYYDIEMMALRSKLGENASVSKELEDIKSKLNQSYSRVKELEENLKKGKEDLDEMAKERNRLLEQVEGLKVKAQSKENELIKIHSQELHDLQEEMKARVVSLEKMLEEQTGNHKKQLDDTITQLNAKYVSELKDLEERWLATSDEQLKDLNSALKEWKEKHDNVQQELEGCRNALKGKEEEWNVKLAEHERLQVELSNSKQQLEESLESQAEKHQSEVKELQKALKETNNVAQSVNDLQNKLTLAEQILEETRHKFEERLHETEERSKERLEIVKQTLITKIKKLQESHKKKSSEYEELLQTEKEGKCKLEEELKQFQEKLEEAGINQHRFKETEVALNNLKMSNLKLENLLEETKKARDNLQKKYDDAINVLQEKEDEVSKLQDEVVQLRATSGKLKKLETLLDQEKTKCTEMATELKYKYESLNELNAQLADAKEKLGQLNEEHITSLEKLKMNHDSEIFQLEKHMEENQGKLEEMQEVAEARLAEIKKLEKEEAVDSLRKELESLESSKQELAFENDKLILILESEQDSVKNLQSQVQILEEKLNQLGSEVKRTAEKETQVDSPSEQLSSSNGGLPIEKDKQVKTMDRNATFVNSATEEDLMSYDSLLVKESEVKYQQDLAALREEIDQLVQQHKEEVEQLNAELEVRTQQLDESLLVAEANQSSALQQLSQVRKEVEDMQKKLVEVEAERNQHKQDLEKLKAEKQLVGNESQKQLMNQVEGFQENSREEAFVSEEVIQPKEQKLESCLVGSTLTPSCKGGGDVPTVQELQKQIQMLKDENCDLVSKLQLAGLCAYDEENSIVKKLQREWEAKLKEKEEELNDKLKQVVCSFSSQLESKETELELSLGEAVEKSKREEERLLWEHRKELVSLEMQLAEKNSALEDVHEYYQQQLQEKNELVKKLTSQLNSSNANSANNSANENIGGDEMKEGKWTPELQVTQTSMKMCNIGSDGLQQFINSNPYSERYHPDPLLPEPTEFEYLRNILFQYMMGKEPMTLAKVIAAVLKFSDDQTHQILQKEEARQLLQKTWLSSARP